MSSIVHSRHPEELPISKQLDLFTLSDAAPTVIAKPEPCDSSTALAPAIDPNLRAPANDMGASFVPLQLGLPATLADVLLQLDGLPLEHRKRGELRSALNTFCRATGIGAARVTTEIESISKLISDVSPSLAGLTLARWTRVRSLLLSALRHCGIDVMPGRSSDALSAPWSAALSLLTVGQRYGLSRFARFMSAQGVQPAQLTLTNFEAFHGALLTGSLHQKPEAAYRSMVRTWNQAAANVAGWPKLIVQLEPDPRRYSRDWADFPAGFRLDVEAYLRNSGNPDPLSEDYYRAASPGTVDQRERQIRQLGSALIGSGFPIDALTSLAVLVTAENAKAALGYLYERKGKSSSKHLASQARLLQTIARHWVKTRVDDVRLGEMASNLKVPSDGMVEKNRKRLLQFDLPDNVSALLNLPAKIARQVDRKPRRGAPGHVRRRRGDPDHGAHAAGKPGPDRARYAPCRDPSGRRAHAAHRHSKREHQDESP
jgi:hypothetical protein